MMLRFARRANWQARVYPLIPAHYTRRTHAVRWTFPMPSKADPAKRGPHPFVVGGERKTGELGCHRISVGMIFEYLSVAHVAAQRVHAFMPGLIGHLKDRSTV